MRRPPKSARAGGNADLDSRSAGQTTVEPAPENLPDVVAKVNGESVERWELENAVKRAEARAGTPPPPDKRDKTHERRAARTTPLAEARPQIRSYLTDSQRQTKIEQFIER